MAVLDDSEMVWLGETVVAGPGAVRRVDTATVLLAVPLETPEDHGAESAVGAVAADPDTAGLAPGEGLEAWEDLAVDRQASDLSGHTDSVAEVAFEGSASQPNGRHPSCFQARAVEVQVREEGSVRGHPIADLEDLQ